MQYTLIIKSTTIKSTGRTWSFKNFTETQELITYVGNMSKGDNRVHKIVRMLWDGVTDEMTIGFNDGRLDLIEAQGERAMKTDDVKTVTPKHECCICGDDPQRVTLKGQLLCSSCYKEIYS